MRERTTLLNHWRQLRPGVQAFGILAGLEALVRGSTLSVFPLLLYRAWGQATTVSEIYFAVGLLSLLIAMTVPMLAQRLSRHWVYRGSICMYIVGAMFGMLGDRWVTLALLCNATGAASAFVCFNAYVLDHVDKQDFSRLETLRMFYGGFGWVLGPALGVWLLPLWGGAPFLLVTAGALGMLVLARHLGLGPGREMVRRQERAMHPLANVRRFAAQPRLVSGWLLALARSCGWWFYFVYIGIYAVEHGLGDAVGGVAASVANLGLFLAPLMLRWMQQRSVRKAVRTGTLYGGLCFLVGSLLWPLPWLAVAMFVLGTAFLVLLDVAANLPFMMAVKPSERTEMASVYSSFRDASGILSPALAWLVLQVVPITGVFAASAAVLLGAWGLAAKLHPQLGVPGARRVRLSRNPTKD